MRTEGFADANPIPQACDRDPQKRRQLEIRRVRLRHYDLLVIHVGRAFHIGVSVVVHYPVKSPAIETVNRAAHLRD